MPTVHAYADHLFITTQSPLLGGAGHVHLLELDQIVGRDYLVTVHGPLNPIVDPAAGDGRDRRGAAPDRVRTVPAGDAVRPVLRHHLRRSPGGSAT